MSDLFLFAILPYVCVAIASVGFAWRFASPRSITSRSSQFLEGRALFWGSVPWHYAVLPVLGAHLFGVLFPGTAGAILGDPARLAVAEMTGLALGLWATVACAVLIVRRAASGRLRVVTTRADALVLGLLLVQVASGVYVAATLRWGSVWYLHTAVPWLGSLARLDPRVELAGVLPPVVQLHAASAFVLLAVAPFSRLVHAAVAPVQYLWRAPQVVRWNRHGAAPAVAGSRVLTAWEPEDRAFWQASGRSIAARNLWISIPALFVSFAVWMVWSVIVLRLPEVGFRLTTDQLFWLTAAPGLSGATLRIFYAFIVPVFGGRRWTAVSTASLLLPVAGIAFAVRDPTTSFGTLLGLALLCGLGGGNFASSMANISFFYPKEQKGTALGLNAGLGNVGVSAMQFLVPVAIGAELFGGLGGGPQAAVSGDAQYWLQNAALIWVPLIVVCAVAAWFGMNDVASAKASFREQAVIFRRADNWILCFLYFGTFGSFIGFSAGFPLLVKSQFPGVDPMSYAFVGPLVGALTRPVGGWLADRFGGARITIWNYAVMAIAAIGVLAFLPGEGSPGPFAGFFAAFLVLFTTTGIGNGSVFRMIPPVFAALHERAGGAARPEAARAAGAKEAAAVIGFSSAVAAYGAFFVPRGFGASIVHTGGPGAALYAFVGLYAACLAVTWWRYGRRGAPAT